MIPLSWDLSFFLSSFFFFLNLFFYSLPPCLLPGLFWKLPSFLCCLFTLYSASPPHFLEVVAIHMASSCSTQGNYLSQFSQVQAGVPSLQTKGKTHRKELVGVYSPLVACSLGILTWHSSHSLFCRNLSSFIWSLSKKESSFFCNPAWD